MNIDYTLSDVAIAKRRIAAAVPGVRFSETDYGFGLSVMKPDMSAALVVFRPQRDDIGQDGFVADIDATITELTSAAPATQVGNGANSIMR